MNVNKVFIGGNLTRDPELRYLQSGSALCEFGVAVNRKWESKGGKGGEEVLFVDVTAWGKTAETIAQHMKKGKPIFIEGRLKLDTWDAKDGAKRTKLTVTCENFQFVGGKNETEDDQVSF